MRAFNRAVERAKKKPRARRGLSTGACDSNIQYLFGFAERIQRFLVLTGLVQCFAFGSQFLHFSRLLCVELCTRHRIIDRLHVDGAMKREGGAARKGKCCCNNCDSDIHVIVLFSLVGAVSVSPGRHIYNTMHKRAPSRRLQVMLHPGSCRGTWRRICQTAA